jgi:hypothetical protein
MRAINFRGRGLSDRTIQALLDHGIDFPEPLLFMEPSQLKKIPGMGKGGFNEIMRYREKFTEGNVSTKVTEKNQPAWRSRRRRASTDQVGGTRAVRDTRRGVRQLASLRV